MLYVDEMDLGTIIYIPSAMALSAHKERFTSLKEEI
jgi:hypothetical protein